MTDQHANHQRLVQAFSRIIDLAGSERGAEIERACRGEPTCFRQSLERLLDADSDPSSLLDAGAGAGESLEDIAGDPEAIGPYSILERIGEGGFGVVYSAQQTEPMRRRVAIKLIKLGMDSRAVVSRFEAERQALAMMDHPSVAKVFDGGVTDRGLPYFVMELVQGLPITAHCVRKDLGLGDRVKLFILVCDAVQHAHTKGVIHRDLKPSNILVVGNGDDAMPKVIDFGIAKALHQQLTDSTIYTAHGQIVGTPAYMSPEQAGGGAPDIDTRADIFSLGVVLYELLVGVAPFDPEALSSGGVDEMRRILREVDPPKPSTKLSTTGAAHADRASIRALAGALRNDLDWVVMKCLEKDRSRRYETANALADDLRRFLRDEPLVAGPPSSVYRLRKFVRRRRGLVVAGSVVSATLLLGVAGTTSGMVMAFREADRADGEAETAARRAGELEQMVGFQEERLGAIDASDMGVTIRDQLGESAPDADYTSVAHAALDEHIFKPTIAEIDRRFADQPLARARLQQSIAVAMRKAGLPEGALPTQRASLALFESESPEDQRSITGARVNVGLVLHALGRYEEALIEYEQALAAARSSLGPAHEESINILSSSGFVLQRLGRVDEAGARLEQAVELASRPEHDGKKISVITRVNFATYLMRTGDYERAEPLLRDALAIARRSLGDEHETTLAASGNLVIALLRLGRLEEAETLAREEVDRHVRQLGGLHPDTIALMKSHADVLIRSGRTEEGEALLQRCIEISTETLGRDHPDTLIYLESLANHLGRSGDYAASYRVSTEIAKGLAAHYGPDDERAITAVSRLGGLAKMMGDDEAAATRFGRVVSARRHRLGPDHRSTLRAVYELSKALVRLGRFAEAEPLAIQFRDRALASEEPKAIEAATENLITLYESWHAADPGGGHDKRAEELRQP